MDAEAAVVDSCQRALNIFKSLGAEIVAIEIPHLRSMQVAHGLIVSAEISAILGETRKPIFRTKQFYHFLSIEWSLLRSESIIYILYTLHYLLR